MTTNGAQATKVVTGKVLIGYEHLTKAYAASGEEKDAKFSCMVIVPKSDKATVKKLRDAEEAAKTSERAKKIWGGTVPKKLAPSIIKDGDDEEETDLERNPELEGCWYFNESSRTAPGIVDRQRQEILDSTEIYSGMFARVSLNAYAYEFNGKKGVTFGLNHVQKVDDGDHLGGRSRAEDDFDELDDEDDDLI